ncbi:MAG: peptidase, partial [Alphaproteobacteria bacterium]
MHRAFTRGLTIIKRHLLALCAGTALTLASVISIARGEDATAGAVLKHYGDMAEAMYGDAHAASLDLGKAIDALIANPTNETLVAVRRAWKEARPWYQHSEAYRFGNAIVDDWEGRVNSWPLDEGLIDYTDKQSYGETSDENPLYTANVIANTSIRIGNDVVDATRIDAELLRKLQQAGGNEANVATGYHAIEFLL